MFRSDDFLGKTRTNNFNKPYLRDSRKKTFYDVSIMFLFSGHRKIANFTTPFSSKQTPITRLFSKVETCPKTIGSWLLRRQLPSRLTMIKSDKYFDTGFYTFSQSYWNGVETLHRTSKTHKERSVLFSSVHSSILGCILNLMSVFCRQWHKQIVLEEDWLLRNPA